MAQKKRLDVPCYGNAPKYTVGLSAKLRSAKWKSSVSKINLSALAS
jgi:hypothetical protein